MKIVIAGSRDLSVSPKLLLELLGALNIDIVSETGHEVVSGGCPTGPDSAAKELPKFIGVTYKEFPPDWGTHGRAAGPIRNRQMAEYGDCLLLVWDGKSRGSASMLSEMRRVGKPVYEVILKS